MVAHVPDLTCETWVLHTTVKLQYTQQSTYHAHDTPYQHYVSEIDG